MPKIDSEPKNQEDSRAPAHVDIEGAAGASAAAGASQLQKSNGRSLVIPLLESDPEIAPLIIAAIKDGLRAHAFFYDKRAKEWTKEPDSRTRLQAAQLSLQYLEGLPLQRIHSQSTTCDVTPPSSEEMLARSPATREAMQRMLDRANARAKTEAEKHVQ